MKVSDDGFYVEGSGNSAASILDYQTADSQSFVSGRGELDGEGLAAVVTLFFSSPNKLFSE